MPSHRELLRSLSKDEGSSFDPILAMRWATFNKTLMKLDEKQVSKLLEREMSRRRRLHVMLRLQSRLSHLRRDRERREIVTLAR